MVSDKTINEENCHNKNNIQLNQNDKLLVLKGIYLFLKHLQKQKQCLKDDCKIESMLTYMCTLYMVIITLNLCQLVYRILITVWFSWLGICLVFIRIRYHQHDMESFPHVNSYGQSMCQSFGEGGVL